MKKRINYFLLVLILIILNVVLILYSINLKTEINDLTEDKAISMEYAKEIADDYGLYVSEQIDLKYYECTDIKNNVIKFTNGTVENKVIALSDAYYRNVYAVYYSANYDLEHLVIYVDMYTGDVLGWKGYGI